MEKLGQNAAAANETTELLDRTIQQIKPSADAALLVKIQQRLDQLTKPQGSLGRLEEIVKQYGVAFGQVEWPPPRKCLMVFCADHGVAREGVSAYPPEVTYQMVLNMAAGGAAVNVLCRQYDIDPVIVDMGVSRSFEPGLAVIDRKVAPGTKNLARERAMSREQAVAAIQTGIRLAVATHQLGYRLLAVGEMGIGNTTAASAIVAAISGLDASHVTGAGTGLSEEQRRRKAVLIGDAVALHRPDPEDAIDVLSAVGGFEIGGMAGFLLGAAAVRVPVCVDGLIATAAALLAARLCPPVTDYLFFAHRSTEPGQQPALELVSGAPLLSLEMRLGEGSGAALAVGIVDSALRLYREMATFSSAGVSDREPGSDAT